MVSTVFMMTQFLFKEKKPVGFLLLTLVLIIQPQPSYLAQNSITGTSGAQTTTFLFKVTSMAAFYERIN